MRSHALTLCIITLFIFVTRPLFPTSARAALRQSSVTAVIDEPDSNISAQEQDPHDPVDVVIETPASDTQTQETDQHDPVDIVIDGVGTDNKVQDTDPRDPVDVVIDGAGTDNKAQETFSQDTDEVVVDEPGTIYTPYIPADNPLWRADYASFDPLSAAYIRYTDPIPAAYNRPASHQGSVIELTYDSFDYTTEPPTPVIKPVSIYLPYGYDAHPKKRYDIIYLMHGWQGTAQDFLSIPLAVSILDHLIEEKRLPPLILACPTVDAENKPQDWPRSLEETMVFHKEVREVLLPFVESQVRTKAKKTSLKGLAASRKHRGFIGFSMGGAVTWNQLLYNLDLFSFYAPMCGDCWIYGDTANYRSARKTVNRMEKLLDKWKKYTDNDYRILASIGTKDDLRVETDNQIREMYTRERFKYGNLRYLIKKDGYHDLDAVLEYVYNVLLEYRSYTKE